MLSMEHAGSRVGQAECLPACLACTCPALVASLTSRGCACTHAALQALSDRQHAEELCRHLQGG